MRWFALVIAAAGCSRPHAESAASVEIVLIHGDIRTLDPAQPHVTALAWAGDRITAVGGDELAQRPGARVIDLHGHSVTPGLIDAHCHLYSLGIDLESVSVRDQHDADAVAHVVGEAARKRPASEWLIGRGWDQNKWPGQQFPTRQKLDAAVADRPVVLERVDGHAVWVNSTALALAKVSAQTQDPAGGKIVRDVAGEPTGVLVDNAMDLVISKMPVASPEVRDRQIRAAAQVAIAKGITGVHEMGITDETAVVYRKLAASHELPLHVYAFLLGDTENPDALRSRAPEPATGRFTMRGVKFFVDGALGSRGARLKAAYDDDPGNVGLWVTEPHVLAASIEAAVAGGWDVAVHAIGDAGVATVLDGFLAARQAHPDTQVHLRVEHTQIIDAQDVPRMVQARAIASMQPTHATSDMPWAEARIGPQRILGAYAWRTILDHGIPLIGGSDFPVEDVGPLLGIYAAVTRQDAASNPPGGWYPAQRMTLDEAIAAFTRDAAKAEGADDRGVIATGRIADLTVYGGVLASDRSLLALPIAMTVVAGEIVYEGKAR